MSGLLALQGKELVAAFVTGGFHVARRERGLALLVRGVQAVVVPETVTLSELRIRALLERAEIAETDLLSWLGPQAPAARTTSGFRRKSEPPAAVHDAVKSASEARARADAAKVTTHNMLETSDALQKSLVRWREALREVDEREKGELRARMRKG